MSPKGADPMDNDVVFDLPSRATRRLIVAGQYAFYLAGVGVWILSGGPGHSLVFWLSPAAFFASILCVSALVARYWFWSNAGECALDEREVAVRNRSYILAYGLLSALVMTLSCYGAFALDNGWWLPDSFEEAYALVMFLVLVGLTLPASVLAWIEPDEPATAEESVPAIGRGLRRRFFTRIALYLAIGFAAGLTLALVTRP